MGRWETGCAEQRPLLWSTLGKWPLCYVRSLHSLARAGSEPSGSVFLNTWTGACIGPSHKAPKRWWLYYCPHARSETVRGSTGLGASSLTPCCRWQDFIVRCSWVQRGGVHPAHLYPLICWGTLGLFYWNSARNIQGPCIFHWIHVCTLVTTRNGLTVTRTFC